MPWSRSRRVVMVSVGYTNTMGALVSNVNTKVPSPPVRVGGQGVMRRTALMTNAPLSERDSAPRPGNRYRAAASVV